MSRAGRFIVAAAGDATCSVLSSLILCFGTNNNNNNQILKIFDTDSATQQHFRDKLKPVQTKNNESFFELRNEVREINESDKNGIS